MASSLISKASKVTYTGIKRSLLSEVSREVSRERPLLAGKIKRRCDLHFMVNTSPKAVWCRFWVHFSLYAVVFYVSKYVETVTGVNFTVYVTQRLLHCYWLCSPRLIQKPKLVRRIYKLIRQLYISVRFCDLKLPRPTTITDSNRLHGITDRPLLILNLAFGFSYFLKTSYNLLYKNIYNWIFENRISKKINSFYHLAI